MDHIAIVIAKEKGGLYAAVKGKGYTILIETIQEFKSLVTCPDDDSVKFGDISTHGDKEGWIAYAIYSGNPV